VNDPKKFLPTTTEVYILHYLQKFYHGKFYWKDDRLTSFDKAMGTSQVRKDIINHINVTKIVSKWKSKLKFFREKSKPYLIYK